MEANGVMLNNMPKIKRNRCFIIVGLLVLLSCGEQKHQIQQTIFADDFLLDDSFLMFSDTPPNPLVASDLDDYKNLGMNVMLLTEDYTPMVDSSGNLTDSYKNSIQAIGDAGMQCWIRNMYNDPDYFDCSDPERKRSNYGTPYFLHRSRGPKLSMRNRVGEGLYAKTEIRFLLVFLPFVVFSSCDGPT